MVDPNEILLIEAQKAIDDQLNRLNNWNRRDTGRDAQKISDRAQELKAIVDYLDDIPAYIDRVASFAYLKGKKEGYLIGKKHNDMDERYQFMAQLAEKKARQVMALKAQLKSLQVA